MTYGFDAEHMMVWVDAFDGINNGFGGVLCRRHADAMVVPLGWMLDDRREPLPRLFKAPASTAATATKPRRHAAAHAADSEQLQLTVEPAPADEAVSAEAEDKPTEPDVLPWKPMFDSTDDLGGLLEARGPLLARAFRGTGRRSSKH
jgi:hypothetical protein